MKQEIKNKITNYVNEKYDGSLRYFKGNVLPKILTPEEIKVVLDSTDYRSRSPESVMVFSFLNDIETRPSCPCGNITKFDQVRKRFGIYCSVACQRKYCEIMVEKRKNTRNKKALASKEVLNESPK